LRIRILDPGFDGLKLKKFYSFTAGNLIYIFLIKIAMYLSLGLHKGRPRYRRSLQPSKENIQQNMNILYFFSIFVAYFALLHPDPDPQPWAKIQIS
jgi:hypothetical protein